MKASFLPTSLATVALALLPAGAIAAPHVTYENRTLTVTGDAANESLTVVEDGSYVKVTGPSGMNDPDGTGLFCSAGLDWAGCLNALVDGVVVDGGAGDDELIGPRDPSNTLTLTGGEGDDRLVRNSRTTTPVHLSAGPGDDTLEAGAGSLGLTDRGEAGDDTYYGSPQVADSFLADIGADTFVGGTRVPEMGEPAVDPEQYQRALAPDTVDYGGYVDALTITLDDRPNDGASGEHDNVADDIEQVYAGAGDDSITAARHAVELFGNVGNDHLVGGDSEDYLDGGDGSDSLDGRSGNDTLIDGDHTSSPPNPQDPPAGNDRLDGGAGNDSLESDRGADDLTGGPGLDRAPFYRYTTQLPVVWAPFTISLDGVANDGQTGTGERDNVRPDVEMIQTSDGDDVISGAPAANVFATSGGSDRIVPGGGPDIVRAGRGRDTILAVDGATDRIECGQEEDRLDADLPGAQPERADVANGCEIVTGRPFPALAALDTRAPAVRVRGLRSHITRRAFKRGVKLRVGADEPVAVEIVLVLRGRTVAGASLQRGGGLRRVTLRPGRAPGGRRAVKAQVRVAAFDAAGNRTVVRRSFTVARRR